MPKSAQSAQKCPECPKVPKSAQSAQKCQECPKMSRSIQSIQKCPKWPGSAQSCLISKNSIMNFFLGHPVYFKSQSYWLYMIHCDLRKLGGAKLETFSNGLFFCSWRTHRDIEEPRFNRSRNMIFANCTKKLHRLGLKC